MRLGLLEVAADQREQPHEVGAIPVAVDVRLAETDARSPPDLGPEGVGPAELDDDRGACAIAEAPAPPVGVAKDDLPSLHGSEGPEREPSGNTGRDARHRSTEPRPGTKGGLR